MATLTISITVADSKVQDVKDAFCRVHEYNPETDGTQNQFIKNTIVNLFKTAYQTSIRETDLVATRTKIATALTDAGIS